MNGTGQLTTLTLLGAVMVLVPACTKHEVDIKPVETRHEIEVKPIQITVDVNIRVDRQLDRFFDFEDELEPAELPEQPATPAKTPAQPAPPAQTTNPS